jgi:uncharacterized protein (TIGR03790 family)
VFTIRGAGFAILFTSELMCAQSPDRVAIVVNDNSALSRTIGEYYARRRGVPMRNLCRIKAPGAEEISRQEYERLVAMPVAEFLRAGGFAESVYYIVTTAGVPLKIQGSGGMDGDAASVDSELTLLYSDIRNGRLHPARGLVSNPFFGKRDQAFSHPQFPMYLVTRLAAYDFNGVKEMIDRSLHASNRGKFVLDLRSAADEPGNDWLRDAALKLPTERVVLDESSRVLYGQTDVIAYAGWGSNDPNRTRRFLGFHWLPGAIATEYVSSNGRTFARPPEHWNIGNDWKSPEQWFAGSPQTLTADYIQEGATGASGHVYEPYLSMTPRPEFILPAYYNGRNLAESYYLGIRALSWQNIVIGDPLCSIGKPQ